MPSKATSSGPALRPFWSGTISFGLVSVPVSLYPATVSGRTPLKLIDPDGALLRRRWFCPEHGRDIHPEHVVRGFELENGKYVVIHDEELEALEPRKTREIDLRQFVDLAEVSPLLFERGYYVTPEGDSNKAYRLLADVMEETKRGGIASFVLRDREYIAVIFSEDRILRLQTLRFPDEVRSPKAIGLPSESSSQAKTVSTFVRTIERMLVKNLDMRELRDSYADRLEQLVRRKLSRDRDVIEVDTSATEEDLSDGDTEDVDLVDAIRRLLKSPQGRSSSSSHPHRESTRHARNGHQRRNGQAGHTNGHHGLRKSPTKGKRKSAASSSHKRRGRAKTKR